MTVSDIIEDVAREQSYRRGEMQAQTQSGQREPDVNLRDWAQSYPPQEQSSPDSGQGEQATPDGGQVNSGSINRSSPVLRVKKDEVMLSLMITQTILLLLIWWEL